MFTAGRRTEPHILADFSSIRDKNMRYLNTYILRIKMICFVESVEEFESYLVHIKARQDLNQRSKVKVIVSLCYFRFIFHKTAS